jgi:hypothetical protein
MSHPQESTTTMGAGLRELLTTAELRRIPLPRTRVNKGAIEKDRSFWRLRSFRLRASKSSEG